MLKRCVTFISIVGIATVSRSLMCTIGWSAGTGIAPTIIRGIQNTTSTLMYEGFNNKLSEYRALLFSVLCLLASMYARVM